MALRENCLDEKLGGTNILSQFSPSNFYWFPMEIAGTRRSTLIILVV